MLVNLAGFGEPAGRPPRLLPQLGAGGLARGELGEIIGPPGSGKTRWVWRALLACQAQGGLGLLVDLAHSWQGAGAAGAPLCLRPPHREGLWAGLCAVLGQVRFDLLVLDGCELLPASAAYLAGCAHLLRQARRQRTALLCTAVGSARPPASGVAACDTPLGAYSSQRLWLCQLVGGGGD